MAKKDPVPQEEITHSVNQIREENNDVQGRENQPGDSEPALTEVKNANASGLGSMGRKDEKGE